MFIILSLGVACSSCSKSDDDDEDNDPPPTSSSLNAKIDGVDWTATTIMGFATETGYALISSKDTENTLGLEIVDWNGEGTYTYVYGENNNNHNIVLTKDGVTYVFPNAEGQTGTVIITERTSSKVKGTFSFTGFNPIDSTTVIVTDGVFETGTSGN